MQARRCFCGVFSYSEVSDSGAGSDSDEYAAAPAAPLIRKRRSPGSVHPSTVRDRRCKTARAHARHSSARDATVPILDNVGTGTDDGAPCQPSPVPGSSATTSPSCSSEGQCAPEPPADGAESSAECDAPCSTGTLSAPCQQTHAAPVPGSMCCVCCDVLPGGARCPAGHYTCAECTGKLCECSIARDPSIVEEAEKQEQLYHVTCLAVDDCVCGTPFSLQSLAGSLSPDLFMRLTQRHQDLACARRLPAEVAKLAAAGSARELTEEQRRAQEEEDVRSAYRQGDSFMDEFGEHVRQCSACGYGPIIANEACGQMGYHHGQLGMGGYTVDNSCQHCGSLNLASYCEWPHWTGELVLSEWSCKARGSQGDAGDNGVAGGTTGQELPGSGEEELLGTEHENELSDLSGTSHELYVYLRNMGFRARHSFDTVRSLGLQQDGTLDEQAVASAVESMVA